MILIVAFLVLVALLGLFAWAAARLARRQRAWPRWRRIGLAAAGLAVIASPYLAFKAWELRFVLARVPAPLAVRWIDYRREESWTFGPGANETGFVVYSLTTWSADYARRMVAQLPRSFADPSPWRATPLRPHEDRRWDKWDGHRTNRAAPRSRASIAAWLDTYGYGIALDPRFVAEAERALNRPDSFYAYGRGGSLTIVDPARGKVYFAYAG